MERKGFTCEAVEELSAYLDEPGWMRDFRLAAFEVYQSLPMPSLRDEAWRRTDIRPLQLDSIGPFLNGNHPSPGSPVVEPPAEVVAPLLAQETGGILVQVDGATVRCTLSEELGAQGVLFTDMHMAVREHGELVRSHFMRQAVPPTAGKFAALHAAFWRGGPFLYVPAGVDAGVPLVSLLWASAGRTFSHTLVVLEHGAQATLVTHLESRVGSGQALHNGAVELLLEDDTRLQYVAVQEWGSNVWQFTHERARLGRNADLEWVISSMGSRLSKSFQTVELDGAGASARMYGLLFADGSQHLDHDTQQNHNAPDTTSDLLFKVALKDRSRSVWQGMIRVLPAAQRTNGYQANRNLLLAETARADSIPGLEIEADDVRCTHGATVGQADEDQVFYLMSRGLPRPDATRLVVAGFFAEVMDRVPVLGARERLQAAIQRRI